MDNLFKEKSQCIRIYMGTETETDPFEHTTETVLLNPIPIKAIVSDLDFSQIAWKMPGIITTGAKSLIIKKNKKALLEQSVKIEIENEDYEGWKADGKLQYKIIENYIQVYIYRKQV